MESGRPQSSLKWASRYRSDFMSPIEVGKFHTLLRVIASFLRFTNSYPILVVPYNIQPRLYHYRISPSSAFTIVGAFMENSRRAQAIGEPSLVDHRSSRPSAQEEAPQNNQAQDQPLYTLSNLVHKSKIPWFRG
ncbi:hypothetical protein LXL04_028917 [Taraxacum kok-saghyz]